MDCVSSLGLGLAVAQPDRRVVALDGDGAALMRMGTLATIGYERPKNFLHILLDDAVHDSTGGQATVSPSVDFASVVSACGYAAAARVAGLDELNHAIRDGGPYPQLLHVKTKPRSIGSYPDRILPPLTWHGGFRPGWACERRKNNPLAYTQASFGKANYPARRSIPMISFVQTN